MRYWRHIVLPNSTTNKHTTTFSVENRLLGNEKSGRGFALSDADTLPQSNQASFSWIFALFFDTSFQRARLNFSHWNNTEKMVRSVCLKPVSMATWRLHTLWRFTSTAHRCAPRLTNPMWGTLSLLFLLLLLLLLLLFLLNIFIYVYI